MPRVLHYYPRYKPIRNHQQYPNFCRVKLLLNHPHRNYDELLDTEEESRFSTYQEAYDNCLLNHNHPDDHYGELDRPDPVPAEDEFEARIEEEDITLEDWQEVARMMPDVQPEEEPTDLLGRRDIDLNFDWSPHIARYTHENFATKDYWTQLQGQTIHDYNVEDLPQEAADTLNPEQRVLYDTILGHYLQSRSTPNSPPSPLRIQVDGGGGTGKSYLIKVLSSHLQQAALGAKSPVIRAAPTGVASNQINGQTLHSLLRLPINNQYKPLSETPTTLNALQRRFNGVHYLIIDEKSMLGLKALAWTDARLREIFPQRRDEVFGGLSVILIGDFFQLPPVLNRALYSPEDGLNVEEIAGRNAYRSFDKSVFLVTIQRQQGDDQARFRQALLELRQTKVSVSSWELLTSRCTVKLSATEVDSFLDAVRIYATKAQVKRYNYEHMLGLGSPALQVEAFHEGIGAQSAESQIAGNLSKSFPVCIGCRVMLTRNLWGPKGLVNGAQGTVYDISWASGGDPIRDPPEVIMVGFDDYTGPSFESLQDHCGKWVVPILRVRQEFVLKNNTCYREQFPLVVSYAITVHKSQGVTLKKVVCDISTPEFSSGLSYVAVSRVSTLEGLMFDAPFDRSRIHREVLSRPMQLKIADYEGRQLDALTEALYEPESRRIWPVYTAASSFG